MHLKLNSKTSVYLPNHQHVGKTQTKVLLTPLTLAGGPSRCKSYKLMEEEGILRTISNVKSVGVVHWNIRK